MHVEIRHIEGGSDHLAGILRLEGSHIVAEPDCLLLRNILSEPVLDWEALENYWPREQPEQFLRALHIQYRSPYLRASKVMEDGAGESVTKSFQARPTEDGGEALSHHYADLWNTMHGADVPDEELQAASEELSAGHHRVTLRPDGHWVAHRFDDDKPLRQWKGYEPAVTKEAEHAPKGGIFLVNMKGEAKFYLGGQWIPAKDIANLPIDQKAKLEAAQQQAKMGRVNRGHINPNELQTQLKPHARQLTNDEQVRAVNELRALHKYHGALTLHRIEQLAKQQQGFLKRTDLTDKQRKQIEGNLARLHAMVPLAQSWGVTGQVPRQQQEQALARTAKQEPEDRSKPAPEATPRSETIPAAAANHPANPNAEGFLNAHAFAQQQQFRDPSGAIDQTKAVSALREIVRRHQEGGGRVLYQHGSGSPVPVSLQKDGSLRDPEGKVLALSALLNHEQSGLKFLSAEKKEEKTAASSANLAEEKAAPRTKAPISPEDAAKARAKQAGHEAQPKEGHDAASELNRQLIAEGRGKASTGPGVPVEEKKPQPSPKPPEEEQFDAAWFKALQEDPVSQKLIDKGQTEAARERVLANLIENGVNIPARVQDKFADSYQKALERAQQSPQERAEHEQRLREHQALHYGSGRATSKERSDAYEKEKWSGRARAEGIEPKHLHAAADEIREIDADYVDGVKRLLKDARDTLANEGYDARALTMNLRSGRVEDRIPYFDELAESMAKRYPDQLGGHDPEQRLKELLTEGYPEPMSQDQVYEKAFDFLREQKEAEQERRTHEAEREPGADEEDEEDRPSSDWFDDEDEDEDAFAFGANKWKALRAWIQKGRRRGDAPGQMHLFDTSKHPHAPAGTPQGGQFVSTHHPQKIQNAQDRYANRGQTAQGGGLFGGEDLQARRGFAKLPDGAAIVFTHGEFEGHTGKIVRDVDAQTGAPRIVATVDGRPGLVPVSPDSIEPLDVRHSWRIEGGGTGREEKQGGLYSAEHFLPRREGGEQSKTEKKKPNENMNYQQTVTANMKHMGSHPDEWSAVPVKGMTEVDTGGGKMRSMPVYEFPEGYKDAPSMFLGMDETCQLCGHYIKNVYWIQNDQKKWLMAVGSECVTNFGEGESGEKLAKKDVASANRDFVRQVEDTKRQLYSKYSYERGELYLGKPTGATVRSWAGHLPGTREAKRITDEIKEALGNVTAKRGAWNQNIGKHDPDFPVYSDRQIANWVKKNGEKMRKLLEEADALLHPQESTEAEIRKQENS